MATSVEIREASSASEIEAVRRLMRKYRDFLSQHPTGSAHFCMTGFEEELEALPAKYRAPGALLVAFVDEKPMGCIAIREMRVAGPMAAVHEADGGGLALELKRLWVRPAGRGLGLGRRLMEAAVTLARSREAGAVYLDTVPAAMPEANRLYGALGFEQVERYNNNDLFGVAYFRLRLGSDVEPAEVTAGENPTIS